ncbi:Macrolide export protein MacA [Pirellula sp. SH-Sr6A]|uniref:efflux RND transporter periplasmic adaptor subunit n=1 Tax=Pirellula sp. SH-Sr6A TaxID=1632865 RepID=UPI00078B94FC|nr:efflux RND transporter periplasmic adaptor subunit [Pirellula sp. SH-Sr6A]AMV32193.1 Macrolide export protein MacA [Pirellula sp. SH-Sr6A]
MSLEESSARDASHRVWKTRQLVSRARIWIALLVILAGGAYGWSSYRRGNNFSHLASQAVWQSVERSNLEIVVLERGSLESQSNIDLVCEVEDVRKDNINGTTVLWMIPNGASVQKDDLVLELDSNPMQEALDEQTLYTENALAEKIQADANLKNQITMNTTAKAEAELLVKLAELELEMYIDKENGTQKLAVDANKRRIDDVNNEILSAQATMELRREEHRGIQSLFKLGYANRNEVRRIELTYLQAEGTFAAKLNQLQTELSTLKKMQVYEQRKELLGLEGKVATAKRSLEQVLRNNEARLAQVQALMRAKDESLKKEEERLARYRAQLEKCKVYAPQSGMVAYPNNRSMEVREGIPVIFRQKLLSIPNLDAMQVETRIHESALDQVRPGLQVRVTVDAFPQKSYRGTVKSVAVLPEQNSWSGNDTKVYQTIINIDESVAGLKPGMTAVSEIMVQNIPDVLTIPLHAILEKDSKTYVLVRDASNRLQPKPVELGESSDTRVHVLSGLEEGESIAINAQDLATAVFDEKPASDTST